MKPRTFINQLDDAKIVGAIAAAEQKSSGEIRLFISQHEIADPLAEAKRQFIAMGMEKTADRNGVLIYFAPRSQKFAVVGDTGVHAKCGADFWDAAAALMRTFLVQGKFTEAILAGIESLGKVLECHFPRRGDDRDELPNEIEGD